MTIHAGPNGDILVRWQILHASPTEFVTQMSLTLFKRFPPGWSHSATSASTSFLNISSLLSLIASCLG
eukprot:6396105-Amphidinium_carterae.1